MDYLQQDITTVKGIGAKRAGLFNKHGVFCVGDLLSFYPRKYDDLSNPKTVEQCQNGNVECVKATLVSQISEHFVRRNMIIYKAKFSDGKDIIEVTVFNNKFIKSYLKVYDEYLIYGKIDINFNGAKMSAPKIISANSNVKIQPIYSTSGQLKTGMIASAVKNALEDIAVIPETISDDIRRKYDLMPLDEAVRNIHFPSDEDTLHRAKHRLTFEELLTLQLGLMQMKGHDKKKNGAVMANDFTDEFFSTLPFKPTNAQSRCAKECAADMMSGYPMSRLLQGDVGSGKTAVAAALMYMSVKNGYQCALMAPTEILASQHYNSFVKFFESTDITIALLTGSTPTSAKKEIKSRLKNGSLDIAIGTHALITKDVEFKNPGLVITDEQHRFGVNQRSALVQSGSSVHNLVMSATPIPRTLGLVIYSDLDISLLDELPKGRQPIRTDFVDSKYHKRIYKFLQNEIAAGHQGYVICPLVDDSEGELTGDSDRVLKSVTSYGELLSKSDLRGVNIAILHGKMTAAEKSAAMEAFAKGDVKVLISTTVVEVGVDVPNATVMIIEDADRFGLSQLHQLRGRIGRGGSKSYCILVSDTKSETSSQRLNIMKECADGFKIADEDLKLRGPGDFFGERQHGLPSLKIADMTEDMSTVETARKCAGEIIKNGLLSTDEYTPMRQKIKEMFDTVQTSI